MSRFKSVGGELGVLIYFQPHHLNHHDDDLDDDDDPYFDDDDNDDLDEDDNDDDLGEGCGFSFQADQILIW